MCLSSGCAHDVHLMSSQSAQRLLALEPPQEQCMVAYTAIIWWLADGMSSAHVVALCHRAVIQSQHGVLCILWSWRDRTFHCSTHSCQEIRAGVLLEMHALNRKLSAAQHLSSHARLNMCVQCNMGSWWPSAKDHEGVTSLVSTSKR